MTVSELLQRMEYAELIEWMALDTLRNFEAEKAQRMAGKGMNTKRPRGR